MALNLENLTKIDEKFQQLIDNLKVNKVNNISQLCSEWWEFTDEDDYSVCKFEKAIKVGGVREIMTAHVAVNGVRMAANEFYNHHIARDTFGFTGLFTSDW